MILPPFALLAVAIPRAWGARRCGTAEHNAHCVEHQRKYSAKTVNSIRPPHNSTALLAAAHESSRRQCAAAASQNAAQIASHKHHSTRPDTATGGWCLSAQGSVSLPNKQSYDLSPGHTV